MTPSGAQVGHPAPVLSMSQCLWAEGGLNLTAHLLLCIPCSGKTIRDHFGSPLAHCMYDPWAWRLAGQKEGGETQKGLKLQQDFLSAKKQAPRQK
jgi:hypothetical protein